MRRKLFDTTLKPWAYIVGLGSSGAKGLEPPVFICHYIGMQFFSI